ncbi:hypothetical protein GW17_00052095, partial [Ensete ventricosum]
KTQEVEQSLAMVRSAMQKAKSSLIKEQCATLERAQMTIAKYKETLSFKLNVEKIGQLRVWVSGHPGT